MSAASPRSWLRLVRGATVATSILLAAASSGAVSHWSVAASSGGSAHAQAFTPAAPSGVSATCTSSRTTEATVRWSAATHATGYTVYTSKTSGTYTALGTTSTTTYTTGSLTTGKYTFEVATSVGSRWTSSRSSPTTPALKMTQGRRSSSCAS